MAARARRTTRIVGSSTTVTFGGCPGPRTTNRLYRGAHDKPENSAECLGRRAHDRHLRDTRLARRSGVAHRSRDVSVTTPRRAACVTVWPDI
jgi:hypothetical protein